MKVLIADDEPDVLETMAKRVISEGFDVVTATDGIEAWEKITAGVPDIVVLDLVMPGKDGFEVLKDLRAHPPSDKWQPVIIVSAKDELADMQKGFALEADHYLTKPCQMDDVVKAVRLMAGLIPQRCSREDIESKTGQK